MKSIKNLYSTAKTRGWSSDISSYSEAINELLESNPNDYISNLEYIISSSIGLNTFKEFTERYGFSIALYEAAMPILESAIHVCERDGKDASLYNETKEWMEEFRKNNIHQFAMYEWYSDEDMTPYINTYYGSSNGVQNRNLAAGLIKKFDEQAVPDILIALKECNENVVNKTMEFIESYKRFNNPLFLEWLSSCIELPESLQEKTASHIVSNMRDCNQQVYRESVITGNSDTMYEYTEDEINAIRDLISFEEYTILWADEFGTSITEGYDRIASLYEELDGMEFTEADDSTKRNDELVPIFCLLRHYGDDADEKFKDNENFKRSVNLCKVIGVVSGGDKYSHAVLAFDDGLKEMYSFESMGIVKDTMESEYWDYTTSVYMSCMFIPKEDKDRLHKMCKDYASNPDTTQYAYSDLIRLFMGTKTPKEDRRFICSGFTAFMLAASNPKNIHKDYSKMRPDDITILPRSFYVTNFKNAEDFKDKKKLIHDKVVAIKDSHLEELEDYNNNLPRILLQDEMRKKKTLDKILDGVMGSKLNSRMREEDNE